MCGILGTVNSPFFIDDLNLIKHRGPDDGDIINLNLGGSEVCLGHRRLSIQDFSNAGHQPMYSQCRSFIIIFNGEIYNHLELRKKLTDVEFKGHSDTETIVNYIAHYGIDSVQDFNGIFAIALLDCESQKIYIVRDRYGVKPIYWLHRRNEFLFASEIRPLRKFTSLSISPSHLATLLKLRYNPSPTTLYEDIQKLRPGHILSYDLNIQKADVRSFITPVERKISIGFNDAITRYGALFEQAIRRQLLADVEVGVLLSGGIDSALVAYYVQKYSDKPIKTFTVGFNENDNSDETADARETARILGTEHCDIQISEDQFEDILHACINIVEEPLGTTSIIPMYYLNKLVAKNGVKVVLTGQGADEPLGGYARYRGEMIRGKVPASIFRLLRPLSGLIKHESIYRALKSLGERDTLKRWEEIYALFYNEEIFRLIHTKDTCSHGYIKYLYELISYNASDSTSAMMSNDIRMNLCDDLLLYTDKISMHFSIEARVPMLDNDLVDFIEGLPVEFKINGRNGKYIHKKFAESVLPREIIYRRKKGFKSPTENWFRGDKGIMYKTMLRDRGSAFAKVFDTDEVARLFELHLSGKRNLEKQLFTLISIYYWMLV